MRGINIIIFILIHASFLLVCGCGKSDLPPREYVSYVKDRANGLVNNRTIGAVYIEVQHKPVSFMIANELKKVNIPESEYSKRKKELDGLEYYDLKLSVDGGDITDYMISNVEERQKRLDYLSFGMRDDIRLVDGVDTLNPVLYHFERSYDIAGHRTFVLAFENNGIQGDKTFIWDGSHMGVAPIKIRFRQNDLDNIPNIKLSNQ